MRVLLTAKHAPQGRNKIGGVQSWCLTVAEELRRLGHIAETWGPELPLPGRFDLGIFANVGDTSAALPLCGRVLAVSHGIIPAEQPRAGLRYCYTSEGVRDHWHAEGPIIRQPIDLAFWSPGGERGNTLVRYSYRAGLDWLPKVAGRLGMDYVHLRGVTHTQARDVLRSAACVLATGRAALEAAACGAPVVILDHRSAYQGPLLAAFDGRQMHHNYSGRGGIEPDEAKVFRRVDSALSNGRQRLHIEAHHDARKIVSELLQAAGAGVESKA